MANFTRNFLAGRMNKVVDQRVLPEGEYVDAMNVRMGSTEKSEVGVVTNTMGNIPLATLSYIDGTPLSVDARCIGAIDDSAEETLYWFVHDPSFTVGATGKLDLIVSIDVLTNLVTYHVISIDDGGGVNTTLNFNSSYLITGVSFIEDLIFFTDYYNAPRFININPSTNRYPNPVANIDQFSAESLLVIKKPPTQAPVVTPILTSGQQNFLETRFICFAYRYRYADGEYSATSQWSEPAFLPKSFDFSINSMLNEGMVNSCNTVLIDYNSGGPLVVGIDLLFKESTKNILKVIEKLDKANLGLANNQVYQYSFDNSKIFTVLDEAQILRLYDNVPRFAKAQTIMGNRLMYGNYIEGYDLIDKNGDDVRLEYTTSLITENIGQSNAPDTYSAGVYNIDPASTNLSVTQSILYIDLTGKPLVKGSSITAKISIQHSKFTGYTPYPTVTTGTIDLNFFFYLSNNYSSVYALATSPEFVQAIGTVTNIQPISTACNGTTFTDQLNCFLPSNLASFDKYGSGINGVNQPFKIITTPASQLIGLQLPAMEYRDGIKRLYEYYDYLNVSVLYQEIANSSSLHSNRGYEIGIVYMDEFNRATTALVSLNNTVSVPCGNSDTKNSIHINIPVAQIAPSWAKRYKFVIKPDKENYETIYSNLFFTDTTTNNVWFLLEGENMQKVENGDRLIVKTDTTGPLQTCAYATVLEKTSQPAGFITITGVTVPAGLYIKMKPNQFNAVADPNAIVAPGLRYPLARAPRFDFATGQYPMNLQRIVGYNPAHPTWEYEDYSVPAGSRIKLYIYPNRTGGAGQICVVAECKIDITFVSSRNYDNMYDWWNGDNIAAIVNNPANYYHTIYVQNSSQEFYFEYIPTLGQPGYNEYRSYIQFNRDTTTNRLWLNVTTGASCSAGTDGQTFFVDMELQVFRTINTIIWETQPSDALPDVFFENDLSFGIDADGNHLGNIQDQDIATNTPGIVDTKFFNCFVFGNGAESYKIRDSIIGRPFNLGERVTTVAAQDYKEANRFSDITYSGIYNTESNVNKLNEFNAGLLNFKHCEVYFGPIQLLDARDTDVLTLQEDKISYVLAEKNLLSDASAGGVITATPAVLGTQIARTEKYGISFNPESYVLWGYDRFFTDAKRGAVIQLKSGSGQNDQLNVISNQNMRTWFRDQFNSTFNYQKLGGFDPYMNEYVLSMNDIPLPVTPQCTSCGVSKNFNLSIGEDSTREVSYCINLGHTVGLSEVNWVFSSLQEGKTLKVSVDYNGTIVDSGYIERDGSITFDKNDISIDTATITLTYNGDMSVSINNTCPDASTINIIEVVLTNNSEGGKTIHSQYRYSNGAFTGPLLSNLVVFQTGTTTPLVSRYNTTSGLVGTGAFPPSGSTMTLSTNAITPDDFVFNASQNKFRYLRSSTLYNNNNADIQSLLLASSVATPNQGSAPLNFANFTVPSSGNYLYLIWDLRSSISTTLCYASTNIVDACCDCTSGTYYLNGTFTEATCIFTNSNLTTIAPNGFYSQEGIVRQLVDGVLLPQQNCSSCGVEVNLCFGVTANDACCHCDNSCSTYYNTYSVTNNESFSVIVHSYNSDGILIGTTFSASSTETLCSIGNPYSDSSITVTFYDCGCSL